MIGNLVMPKTMLTIVKNNIQSQVKQPVTGYNIVFNSAKDKLVFVIYVEGTKAPIIADYENDSIVNGIKGMIRTKIGEKHNLDAFKIEYKGGDIIEAFVTVYHKDKNGNKKIDKHEL